MPSALPIRAVLFDYGNVLTAPPDPAAWAQMLQITNLSDEAFHEAYWQPRLAYDRGDLNGPDYWLTVGRLASRDLTPSQIEALIAADTVLWSQPNQPMIDWAARLQAAGTPTGILSNLGDSIMHGLLAELPWLHHFDHLTWSHTLNLAKTELRIYQHAAKGLATQPAQILFIDDREDNIDGAITAGMQAIRYTTQPDFEREMTTRGLLHLWKTGQR